MIDEIHNGSSRQRRRRLRQSFDHQKEEQIDSLRDDISRGISPQMIPRPTFWPQSWPWWRRAIATLVLALVVVCLASALGISIGWISFQIGIHS